MASAADRGPVAAATAPEDRAALPVANRGLLIVGVMAATIMQILDTTIANVAIPHMQSALGATADTITWVLTSYIVASAVAIPITGWLADRVGSRTLFLASVVGFIGSSMLCGLAQNLTQMVIFRFLQGISASFLNPLSQSVMLDISPPRQQARAMSIWGMGIMVGPIAGPLIGGWLTENYDWRWVFFVNLPVGIACFAILFALLPSRPVTRRRFDLFGFALLGTAITSLQLMLDRGQTADWFASGEIWVYAVVMTASLWMLVVHLATAREPMFDRALFRDRNLATALGFMFVVGIVMMATMALLPPMLQRLYGYPVLDTGMLLMPRGFGVLASMAVAGKLMQRGVDTRLLIGTGLSIAALSLWQMTSWSLGMGSDLIILSGLIQGIGLGLVFIPLNITAFATLPPRFRTEASSLVNLFRNIGASVGISAVTAVLARNIQTSHADIGSNVTAYSLDNIDPAITGMFADAGQTAMAMLDLEVNRQAAMIAYLDDFWMMMWVTAIAIPLVLMLRPPPRNRGGPARGSAAEMGH